MTTPIGMTMTPRLPVGVALNSKQQASRPSSSSRRLLVAFLAAGLLFEVGAFRLQLAGVDPGLDPNAPNLIPPGSITIQILTGSTFVIAGGLFICSRRTIGMVLGTWPIFLLPAMAFASMLWSPDPQLTLRKSVALTATVLFGFLIPTVLNTRDAVRLLGRVLSLTILLSILCVFLYPRYGVHNAADGIELGLAGDWRGVFSHRTALGHVAGLTVALLISSGRLIWSSSVVRFGVMLLSILCIVEADSGGGFLTAAFVPCALLVTQALVRLEPARRRSTVLALLLLATMPMMLFVPKLLPTLLSILNKQADLTGRIPLWNALLVLAQEHLLLGYGYVAGFLYEVQPRVLAATGSTYAHCHNGYLEVLIAFGYFGLAICLALVVWLLKTTAGLVVAPPPHLGRLSGFPFIVVMYTLATNCFESTLITESSYGVALLALAAGLATRAKIEAQDLHAITARFARA